VIWIVIETKFSLNFYQMAAYRTKSWASGGGKRGISSLDFGNILLNVLISVFNNKWL